MLTCMMMTLGSLVEARGFKNPLNRSKTLAGITPSKEYQNDGFTSGKYNKKDATVVITNTDSNDTVNFENVVSEERKNNSTGLDYIGYSSRIVSASNKCKLNNKITGNIGGICTQQYDPVSATVKSYLYGNLVG